MHPYKTRHARGPALLAVLQAILLLAVLVAAPAQAIAQQGDPEAAAPAQASDQQAASGADGAATGDTVVSLHLYRAKLTMPSGKARMLKAFACPAGANAYGTDRKPGTADDDCVAAKVAWSVKDGGVAAISAAKSTKVKVSGKAAGSTRIEASLGKLTAEALVTVKALPTAEPKADEPRVDEPKADPTDEPKADPTDAPQADEPKADPTDAPQADAPQADEPDADPNGAPQVNDPTAEPKADDPTAEPKVDEPNGVPDGQPKVDEPSAVPSEPPAVDEPPAAPADEPGAPSSGDQGGKKQANQAATFLSPFQVAASVPVLIQARLANHVGQIDGTSGNCIKYSPQAGTNPWTDWVSAAGSPSTAWTAHGYSGSSCPGSLSTAVQSAIGFSPSAVTTVQTGQPFLLGLMTHNNNPISVNDQYFNGQLGVQLLGQTLTFPWTLNETPNQCSGTDCSDDLTTFSNTIGNSDITVDGIDYRLVLLGFIANGSGSIGATAPGCPAYTSGGAVSVFRTKESMQTWGCLYAELVQKRPLTIKKVVSSGSGIPGFDFSSTSNLAGSPWGGWSGTLTPTGTGAGNGASTNAKLFLPLEEDVVVTEAAEAGWALDSIVCKDTGGSGAEITGYTVNLDQGKVTLNNVPDANSAAAAPITCVFTNSKLMPALLLDKTASPKTYDAVGNVIGYSYLVTNSGNVRLAGPVSVADDKASVTCPAVSTVGNHDAYLDPGEAITCTASYTIGQADLNAGSVTNKATASAGGTTSNQDQETVTAQQKPALLLDKTASPKTYDAVGNVIGYSYLVTNSGNVRLAGPVSVADDKASVTCPAVSTVGNHDAYLDPGEAITCTASYTIGQADLNAGSVTNKATASAGGTTSNQDQETVTAIQAPAFSIEKTSTDSTFSQVGDVLDYTVTFTNTGNVTLTGVVVSDDMVDVTLANWQCSPVTPASVAPGGKVTCTGSYTIKQADLDKGSVLNTACAVATGLAEKCDDLTITGQKNPAFSIEKTSTDSTFSQVGDVLDYTVTFTNTGNVTLTGVVVSDDMVDVTLANWQCSPVTPASVAPGGKVTCTGSYTIKQADLDKGSVLNTACAVATGLAEKCDDLTITGQKNPAFSIEKTSTDSTFSQVGDVLDYTVTFTNTGNVTLTGVVVSDDMVDVTLANWQCSPVTPASVAPGGKVTCTGSYTIKQADLDKGSVLNTACAVATGLAEKCDDLTITGQKNPAFSIEKTSTDSTFSQVGDVLDYTVTFTNTGNVTLTGVVVSDDMVDVTLANWQCSPVTPASVAPGGKVTCTGSYTIKQADLDKGSVLNTACAVATGLAEKCDDLNLPASKLEISKSAEPGFYALVGDQITYTITATNTGGTTLQDVDISDALIDGLPSWECTPANGSDLLPGASIVCTATYEVTGADIEAGSVLNTACADSDLTPEVCDDATVKLSKLQIVKEASVDFFTAAGDQIGYTITATNVGEATLTDVDISDDLIDGLGSWECTPPLVVDELAPGETIVCTATYTVTAADVAAGSVPNSACADSDETPEVCDDVDVPLAKLEIVKEADAASYSAAGDEITYTITATNTGEATLEDVDISDELIDGLDSWVCQIGDTEMTMPVASLVSGQSITCSATYTVTAADVDAGSVPNAACAVSDQTDEVCDEVDVPLAELEIVKEADVSSFSAAGDLITYTITATNTGEADLTGVDISDELIDGLGSWTCDPALPADLVPGEAITCSATYTVTAADVDAGSVPNAACAVSDQTDEVCDEVDVPLAELEIVKEADVSSFSAAGDLITYTITATNTGEADLTGVDISDELIDGLGSWTCDPALPADLVPGEAITCSATYTVTAADVDAGSVPNAACAVSDQTDEVCDEVDVPLAELEIVKEADVSSFSAAGDLITYTITATNTGEIALADVDITDSLIAGLESWVCDPALPVSELAVGASVTCSATYTVTAADVEAGSVYNQACVDSDESLEVCDDVDTPLAELEIVKEASVGYFGSAGDQITYTITATNTGEADLTGVDISDALIDGLGDWSCDPALPADLQPGEAITCSATYTVTDADMDAGSIFNIACAISDQTDEVCDDVTITPIVIDITKTPDKTTVFADQKVKFTLEFGHDLPYDFYMVSLVDDVFGDLLDPGNPNAKLVSNECDAAAVGFVLEPNVTYTCSFVGKVNVVDEALKAHRNTVAITVTDGDTTDPQFATAEDTAVVKIAEIEVNPCEEGDPDCDNEQPPTDTLSSDSSSTGGMLGGPLGWMLIILLSGVAIVSTGGIIRRQRLLKI